MKRGAAPASSSATAAGGVAGGGSSSAPVTKSIATVLVVEGAAAAELVRVCMRARLPQPARSPSAVFAAYSSSAEQQPRRVYEARVLSEPTALAAKDSYVTVRVLVGRVRRQLAGVHAHSDRADADADADEQREKDGERSPVITTGASVHAQLLVSAHVESKRDDGAGDDDDGEEEDEEEEDGDDNHAQADGDGDDDAEARVHDRSRAGGRRSLRNRAKRVAAAREARRQPGGRAPRSADAPQESSGDGGLGDEGVEELSGELLHGKWGVGALQPDEEPSARERYDAFSVVLVYVRVSALSSAVDGRSFAVRLFFHEPSGGVPWLLLRTGFFGVLSKAALSARRRREREQTARGDARASGSATAQRAAAAGSAATANESVMSAVRTLMASLETDVSARPQSVAQQAAAQASRSLHDGATGSAVVATASASAATPEQLRALDALRQVINEDEATLVQLHRRVAVLRERQAYAKQQLVQMASILRNDSLPLQVVEQQVQSIVEATTARVRAWTAEQ